jgi:hypothetical protein
MASAVEHTPLLFSLKDVVRSFRVPRERGGAFCEDGVGSETAFCEDGVGSETAFCEDGVGSETVFCEDGVGSETAFCEDGVGSETALPAIPNIGCSSRYLLPDPFIRATENRPILSPSFAARRAWDSDIPASAAIVVMEGNDSPTPLAWQHKTKQKPFKNTPHRNFRTNSFVSQKRPGWTSMSIQVYRSSPSKSSAGSQDKAVAIASISAVEGTTRPEMIKLMSDSLRAVFALSVFCLQPISMRTPFSLMLGRLISYLLITPVYWYNDLGEKNNVMTSRAP